MDRVGGLDEYLLKLPLKDIHSEKILNLRKRIAQSYEKKTMIPIALEKKIKAVLEWNVEQKNKKGEQVGEEEEEDKEALPGLTSEAVEEDYLDKLFARFTVKQEQPQPQPEEENREVGPIPFNTGRPTSDPPRPSPQEFPESLFS